MNNTDVADVADDIVTIKTKKVAVGDDNTMPDQVLSDINLFSDNNSGTVIVY